MKRLFVVALMLCVVSACGPPAGPDSGPRCTLHPNAATTPYESSQHVAWHMQQIEQKLDELIQLQRTETAKKP